jgi:hypothetical protein
MSRLRRRITRSGAMGSCDAWTWIFIVERIAGIAAPFRR